MAKTKTPQSKAIVTKITATSRTAVKIRDNYYTVEYSEERSIPSDTDVDIEFERDVLWKDVNNVVDYQVEEIVETFKHKN